jgi:hypothetical protein
MELSRIVRMRMFMSPRIEIQEGDEELRKEVEQEVRKEVDILQEEPHQAGLGLILQGNLRSHQEKRRSRGEMTLVLLKLWYNCIRIPR